MQITLILNMVNSIEDKKRISYNVSSGRQGELCGFDTNGVSRQTAHTINRNVHTGRGPSVRV